MPTPGVVRPTPLPQQAGFTTAEGIALGTDALGVTLSADVCAELGAYIDGRVPAWLLRRCTPSQWTPLIGDALQRHGLLSHADYLAAVEASANVSCGLPIERAA